MLLGAFLMAWLFVSLWHLQRAPNLAAPPARAVSRMDGRDAGASENDCAAGRVAVPAGVLRETAPNTATQVLAILKAWEDNDDSADRPRRFQELEALLSGTNALELIEDLPLDLTGYAFAVPSVRERLMADPAAALNWMEAHTNVASQALTLVHDWEGRDDGVGLQEYIAALPDGSWRENMVALAGAAAFSRDPAEAIDWARQLNPGPEQTRLLDMAANGWAKTDPAGATAWVAQVSDPLLRQDLIQSLVAGYAEVDPEQAAGEAVQSLPAGPALNQSVGDIAWSWALRDPAAAGAWAVQCSDDDARNAALENLMVVWGNHDPGAALAWIDGLPQGTVQSEAAANLLAVMPEASSHSP